MPDEAIAEVEVEPIPDRAGPSERGPGPEAVDPRPRPTVGTSTPHESAREHVAGSAVYLDDIPPCRGELVVDFVGSPVARGRLTRLDLDAARAVDGVVAILTADDVPGSRTFGAIVPDEELLAWDELHHLGQPVALIAAETRQALRAAKQLIRVEAEAFPPVLTIDDAIAGGHILGPARRIARGDAAGGLARSTHTLRGEVRLGGQEHFYLEPQAARAVPGEGGQILVQSSTQNPSEVQSVVASVLGLHHCQVVCECRRMGGAFGGKESQAAHPAALVALMAAKTGRAARIVYARDQDMQVTGKRHPYLAQYEVGFERDGTINALRMELFSDGGCALDLSLAVLERSMLHADNAYYIPDVEVTGTACRTNLPSNTAFRGFGGPQGIAATECVVAEVATFLGIDALDVRRRNLYGPAGSGRDVTPYGQVLPGENTLPAVVDGLAESSDYPRRRAEIDAFNASSRDEARGLALVPVKFGISFTRRTLNQANALVHIYLDGTVQVSTGGTEMGQGLHTKIRQLVADEFALPADAVRVMPTSTEKNNNTSPTAASCGTDLNGTAAVRACQILKGRLAPVAAALLAAPADGLAAEPERVEFREGAAVDRRAPGRRVEFKDLIRRAYEERVDLGARGFYATPGVDFNRETGRGSPFLYYTTGAVVAEARVDLLTGAVAIERADILMDLGRPINPAIDRGQVVGGFVQGLGWATTEELRYSDAGELSTCSPSSYKIPAIGDVPADLRVDFLDRENPTNVAGSKAVGEPPFVLGLGAWLAVKDALRHAAPGRGVGLGLPATGEAVLRLLAGQTSDRSRLNDAAPVERPDADR